MAKTYTTSTASVKVPVAVSFVCPKCGKLATVSKNAVLSAQATVRGYNSSAAGQFAQQNLASSAGNQLNLIADSLEKGQLNMLYDGEGKKLDSRIICPHCGTQQIIETAGKQRTLYPKGFVWKMIVLILAVIFLPTFGLALSAAKTGNTTIPSGFIMLLELACVAAVAGMILYNRKQSQTAWTDPELMDKRYHSVINRDMDALLMFGLGKTNTVKIGKK